MTDSVEQAKIIAFASNVIVLAQQMGSRFRPRVNIVSANAEETAIERFDKVGSIEVTSRHADTVAQDATHDRRLLKMREFRSTLLLDDKDDLETIINPQGEYAMATARRLNVNLDELVREAAFADVKTGKNFENTVTFANDGGTTIAHGGTGLTYSKLITAQENFINNNVGVDGNEKLYLAITGQQNTNLMNEEKLTSGDYNTANDFIRERGRMVQAAGFELVHFSGSQSPAIINKTGTTRDCIAFSSDAIRVGIMRDIQISVDRRPDKNNCRQIQASMFLGATRTEGAKIQKIECTEA